MPASSGCPEPSPTNCAFRALTNLHTIDILDSLRWTKCVARRRVYAGRGGAVPSTNCKWTILPADEATKDTQLSAVKGGKAHNEVQRRRDEARMKYPLKLPLYASPLETGPSATRKASRSLVGNRAPRNSQNRQPFVHDGVAQNDSPILQRVVVVETSSETGKLIQHCLADFPKDKFPERRKISSLIGSKVVVQVSPVS